MTGKTCPVNGYKRTRIASIQTGAAAFFSSKDDLLWPGTEPLCQLTPVRSNDTVAKESKCDLF